MSRPQVICNRCGKPRRLHRGRWEGSEAAWGTCPINPGRDPIAYPIETSARTEVPRPQLWAVIDAAKSFHARALSGRVGTSAYVAAAERLELELARLPETAWR